MRWLVVGACIATSGLCQADKLLLIPIDSRPAATDFARKIGAIAGVNVVLPPEPLLGRFTQPGNPDQILDWLREYDFSDVSGVIVSLDMIAYGGLIASRVPDTTYLLAIQRLRRLWRLRRDAPTVPFYGFSSTMRLLPTATKDNAAWRGNLGRLVELRARQQAHWSKEVEQLSLKIRAKVPVEEVRRYAQARERDHMVQREIIRMTASGVFNFLIVGQDDAKPVGPHIAEVSKLKSMVANLRIGERVYFCEGIDQHSNVLVCRAALQKSGWSPRVRVVYSDEAGKRKVANYEAATIEQSLLDQLRASGATPALGANDYDYSLYVNTPAPRAGSFRSFLTSLKDELDQGFPVAVADINLGKTGYGDAALFDVLLDNSRITKLLSYAGWNTAGNTMGTSLPAANLYLLARRVGADPLARELAQREFILHRIIDDFEYHKYTRPQAYAMIDASPGASREETYGTDFDRIDAFVREDLIRRLDEIFRRQFLGQRFFAGTRQYEFSDLTDVQVGLPWPRAYEVRVDFKLGAREILAESH